MVGTNYIYIMSCYFIFKRLSKFETNLSKKKKKKHLQRNKIQNNNININLLCVRHSLYSEYTIYIYIYTAVTSNRIIFHLANRLNTILNVL